MGETAVVTVDPAAHRSLAVEANSLKPGDVVFTENPTYDRTITMLRRHGIEVVGVPLQADGPDVDALDALAALR